MVMVTVTAALLPSVLPSRPSGQSAAAAAWLPSPSPSDSVLSLWPHTLMTPPFLHAVPPLLPRAACEPFPTIPFQQKTVQLGLNS